MKRSHTSSNASPSAYNPLIGATVVDRNGVRAKIHSVHQDENATMAMLMLENGNTLEAELSELERHRNEFFLPIVFMPQTEYQQNHEHGQSEWHDEIKIPVQEEEININKQQIDKGKGVRVKKHALEHEEIVSLPRMEEILSVKQVEIGEIVPENNLPQVRQEGDTYIIPVFEEVYVVEKKIRLKEEVHIVKRREESKEEKKILLRSEEVSIERFDEKSPRD